MITEEQLRENRNADRLAFCKLAGNEFDDRLNHMVKVNEFLKDKPFKLGQVVVCKVVDYIDQDKKEAVYKEQVGIVIRHGIPDDHGDYYRIHFDDKDDFSATREDSIRALREDEEIPEGFEHYDVRWRVGDYTGLITTLKCFK